MTHRSKHHLLLLDFDGVIINSKPLMEFAFAASCSALRIEPPPPIEQFLALMGMPLPGIAARLGLPVGFVAHYQALCRERMDMVRLYDGAHALIERGRASFHRLALITGKDRHRTLLLLDRFELRDAFDRIVCGDDPYPGKPSPVAVDALRHQLAASAAETYMVGDSAIDIECARRGHVLAIGAAWGFSTLDELRAAGADLIFTSPFTLADWLVETRPSTAAAPSLTHRMATDG
ncbi:MAG TPA: HAD family hydrolase [Kofleriaceae bacterium]|jgi:phosphoglycolate phosphatase|nr:HAD family hydrolase [Kofleriaceae bacterium]